ncbi:hypothetical protein I4F81_004595 [Pyropia yezoensis]|uniref:Uncharacterized protein n=1 Tax=Pyropia yezoensis TaxID=2788 RepID=A0ACC3BVR8_PYRYE|nr:hypothetical protein I4F81_004595 [Neopyropia yezoensis]
MEDLSSVSAALAVLGYGPTSAPVFAARAVHHAAQLLYESAGGELLVTVLVGHRTQSKSLILYLCDSVNQALRPAGDDPFSQLLSQEEAARRPTPGVAGGTDTAGAANDGRHELPEIPGVLSLPEMCGHDYTAPTGDDVPEAEETVIPGLLCSTILETLRRNHTKDQMAVRSWYLMLKVATTALLNRLPATTARSKRAPTYKALTPKAAATATITFADGASYHTVKRPMMGNTGSTVVHPTLAIILFMAHLGDPLYL